MSKNFTQKVVRRPQGWNKLWGGGVPQISMQWGETRPLPPLSDGITV